MIIRGVRSESYTVVSNEIIDDPDVDWRHLGLLVYLLSKPDYWEVSTTQLSSLRKAGIDEIRASLRSLRAAGYVQMKKKANGGVDWIVFDVPQLDVEPADKPEKSSSEIEKPELDNPDVAKSQNWIKPNRLNPALVSTEYKQTSTDTQITRAREKTLIAEDFQIDVAVRARLFAAGVQMPVAEFLLSEFVNENISTGYVSHSWSAAFASYCNRHKWRFEKHEQSIARNKKLSGRPDNAATRHHDRIKKIHAQAIIDEQGDEDIQPFSGEVSAQVDIGD